MPIATTMDVLSNCFAAFIAVTPPADPSAPTSAPVASTPGRPPPVAPNTATVFTARRGDEADVSRSKYRIGKGLTVGSKDGRFSLTLRMRAQIRYDVEHPNQQDEVTQHSLQIRRLRVVLQGNVFSPHVRYRFQFGFSPNDMQNGLPSDVGSIRRNPLRDFRIEFDRLRDFNVWFGQFKAPFSRQRMLSSSDMNLVDRAITNAEFTLDRDLGVQVMSKDVGGLGHRIAYYAGVFFGEGRNAFELTDPGLLYVGRLEINPFGKFEDYSEGDLERMKQPGLSIGGAYAYQDRAHPARGVVGDLPADKGTTDFHHVNTDIHFKWRGLSVATAFHLRKGFNRKGGGAVDDAGVLIPTVPARSGVGWYTQLGWLVPKIPLEIVGRYGLLRNIYGEASSMRDADEAGGGINWYIVGHDLKLQLDYFRLWDSSMGATPREAAAHGTDRVRLQLQVYF